MLNQASVEAEATRVWRSTPAVRREFGTQARYTAYTLAMARGQVGALGPAPGVIVGATAQQSAVRLRAAPSGQGESLQLRAGPSTFTVSAPVQLKANGSGALPAKFSGIAYSGGLLTDRGKVIDLSTTRFKVPMPLLFQHLHSVMVGVVEQAQIDGGKLAVSGTLFSDVAGSEAERIAQLAARGGPYEMSVGLFECRLDSYTAAGAEVEVNGRSFRAPVSVYRGGVLREVSIVGLGADPNTSTAFFSL